MSKPPQNLVYNWIKRYQNLEKGYNFQVKKKRKYLKIIKNLRQERKRLRDIIKIDETLLKKLNRNSIPIR
tara:strand:+ start:75 stop:284 length:210 start_codon:yes stop_codon:yes gene_type:complete